MSMVADGRRPGPKGRDAGSIPVLDRDDDLSTKLNATGWYVRALHRLEDRDSLKGNTLNKLPGSAHRTREAE